jgi:hypothetical protein
MLKKIKKFITRRRLARFVRGWEDIVELEGSEDEFIFNDRFVQTFYPNGEEGLLKETTSRGQILVHASPSSPILKRYVGYKEHVTEGGKLLPGILLFKKSIDGFAELCGGRKCISVLPSQVYGFLKVVPKKSCDWDNGRSVPAYFFLVRDLDGLECLWRATYRPYYGDDGMSVVWCIDVLSTYAKMEWSASNYFVFPETVLQVI